MVYNELLNTLNKLTSASPNFENTIDDNINFVLGELSKIYEARDDYERYRIITRLTNSLQVISMIGWTAVDNIKFSTMYAPTKASEDAECQTEVEDPPVPNLIDIELLEIKSDRATTGSLALAVGGHVYIGGNETESESEQLTEPETEPVYEHEPDYSETEPVLTESMYGPHPEEYYTDIDESYHPQPTEPVYGSHPEEYYYYTRLSEDSETDLEAGKVESDVAAILEHLEYLKNIDAILENLEPNYNADSELDTRHFDFLETLDAQEKVREKMGHVLDELRQTKKPVQVPEVKAPTPAKFFSNVWWSS